MFSYFTTIRKLEGGAICQHIRRFDDFLRNHGNAIRLCHVISLKPLAFPCCRIEAEANDIGRCRCDQSEGNETPQRDQTYERSEIKGEE